MKKINYYLTFFLLIVSVNFSYGESKPYTEIKGTKAKMLLFSELEIKGRNNPSGMSTNGRYICGSARVESDPITEEVGPTAGFVYDIEKDTTYYYEGGAIYGVSDDGVCVSGNHIYHLFTGQKIMLKRPAGYKGRLVGMGISGDGKTIVGTIETPGMRTVIWGANGDIVKLAAYLWTTGDGTSVTLNQPFSNSVSKDGSVFAGRGDWRVGEKQICNFSPLLWTNRGDSVFHIRDTNMEYWNIKENPGIFQLSGEFMNVSANGKVATGYVSPKAMYYTKEKGKQMISPPSHWEEAYLNCASENGYAAGYFENRVAGLNRQCFVWSEQMGLVTLKSYALDLFGLDISAATVWYTRAMSADARKLLVAIAVNGTYRTGLILFDDEMLNAVPYNLVARQQKGTLSVNLEWEKPLYNKKQLLGYNLYFDSIKINQNLLLELTFTHTAQSGLHQYAVEAVYSEGASQKIFSKEVNIIGLGDCLENEYMSNTIIYNRNVITQWDMPGIHLHTADELLQELTSESGPSEPLIIRLDTTSLQGKESQNLPLKISGKSTQKAGVNLDLLDMHNLPVIQSYAVARIRDNYYVTDFSKKAITVYDLNWKIVNSFSISNIPACLSATTDGTYLYVGAYGYGPYIYQIDVDEQVLIRRITAKPLDIKSGISHLTYNPTLNENKGGFEVGRETTSFFIDMDGELISEGLSLMYASGTAYHNGYYYVAQQTQNGINSSNYCQVHVYDAKTGLPTGEFVDLADFMEVQKRFFVLVSAGISVYKTIDGIDVVGVVVQNNDGKNAIIELDLFGHPDIDGYNLFRNNVKVNNLPLPNRRYCDTLFQKGTYTYRVESIFKLPCETKKFATTTAIIDSISPCPKVTELKAVELVENVVLNWKIPASYSASILWFNIYKNDIQLNSAPLLTAQWSDIKPGLGKHSYKVESFFSNSCTSVESVEIEVTHKGSCQPISSPSAKVNQTGPDSFNTELKWYLPYFSGVFPLKYGTGTISPKVFGMPPSIAAMIGWTKDQLTQYSGYQIVGVEMYIADESTIAPLVMVDDKILYRGSKSKSIKNEYNRLMFENPVSMNDCQKEIAVGYICEMEEGAFPLTVDIGPAIPLYGDVVSIDPSLEKWGSLKYNLGVDANWILSALITKSRPIDGTENTYKEEDLITMKLTPNWRPQKMTATAQFASKQDSSVMNAPKAEDLKLLGFNVYRDGAKINPTLLKSCDFVDVGLKKSQSARYRYAISSVWEGCDEIECVPFYVLLVQNETDKENVIAVYPNPAKTKLYIDGTFEKVSILDVQGRKVKEILKHQGKEIDVQNLRNGLYLITVEMSNNQKTTKKITINH